MRSIVDEKYSYIFNAWSDGKTVYSNNNEGMTMKSMEELAKTDSTVKERVRLFRYRCPEELYDIERDPDSLHNLVNDPECQEILYEYRQALEDRMSISARGPFYSIDHIADGITPFNHHQGDVFLRAIIFIKLPFPDFFLSELEAPATAPECKLRFSFQS